MHLLASVKILKPGIHCFDSVSRAKKKKQYEILYFLRCDQVNGSLVTDKFCCFVRLWM